MNKTVELLGDKAEYLLSHTCKTIDRNALHLPSPHTVDKIWLASDRNIPTLCSLQRLLGHGRLAGTGYVSILPVDQGIEHTAGASFASNPLYFDPENIVRLAIEGGCNAVASTLGVLGARRPQLCAQDSVHREDQPQRAADLPQRLRPGALRLGRTGVGDGRRGRGCHDLLRIGPKAAGN